MWRVIAIIIAQVCSVAAIVLDSGVLDDEKETFIAAAKDAFRDTLHAVIVGKQSLEEWAEIASKGIDGIVDRTRKETNMQYLGGKLFFKLSEKNPKKVEISFDTYFKDENDNLKKVSATSDVFASTFTDEAIEELRTAKMVEYNLEE